MLSNYILPRYVWWPKFPSLRRKVEIPVKNLISWFGQRFYPLKWIIITVSARVTKLKNIPSLLVISYYKGNCCYLDIVLFCGRHLCKLTYLSSSHFDKGVWRLWSILIYDSLSNKSKFCLILGLLNSVTRKNCQMSIKVAQHWFHLKNDRFWHLYKNCLRMWEIRSN